MRHVHRVRLEEEVAFLRDPRSYAGRVTVVSAVETHFAWVFLSGRYAYKLKKPLRHKAMDYRTLASREHGCREELRLNRRLARGVYLSVVPLVRCNGGLALGKRGQVVDWLVRMRRLPDSRMLDHVLARRTLRTDELNRLVAILVRFFARARRAPMAVDTYLGRLRRQVAENRRVLRQAGPEVNQERADTVARLQRQFLGPARRLLAARAARVVEGHGDLRAEHICLGPPLCVIDCLEFSRELRRLDPLEEIAFLSLEIERLGRPALAAELVHRFVAARDDPVAAALMSFYKSHRACTGGKLAVGHLGDAQFPDPRPWLARANSCLREAERHAGRALRQLAADRSARGGRRPVLEQWRKRYPGEHAYQRFPKKRSDRQDSRLAAG